MNEEKLREDNAALRQRCKEIQAKLTELEKENAELRWKLMQQAQLLKPPMG